MMSFNTWLVRAMETWYVDGAGLTCWVLFGCFFAAGG